MSNKPRHAPAPTELQSISSTDLANVAGGAGSTTTPTATTSNEEVMTALTGILDSIKSLAAQPTSSALNQQEMFLLMMLMKQRNDQQLAALASGTWVAQSPYIRFI